MAKYSNQGTAMSTTYTVVSTRLPDSHQPYTLAAGDHIAQGRCIDNGSVSILQEHTTFVEEVDFDSTPSSFSIRSSHVGHLGKEGALSLSMGTSRRIHRFCIGQEPGEREVMSADWRCGRLGSWGKNYCHREGALNMRRRGPGWGLSVADGAYSMATFLKYTEHKIINNGTKVSRKAEMRIRDVDGSPKTVYLEITSRKFDNDPERNQRIVIDTTEFPDSPELFQAMRVELVLEHSIANIEPRVDFSFGQLTIFIKGPVCHVSPKDCPYLSELIFVAYMVHREEATREFTRILDW